MVIGVGGRSARGPGRTADGINEGLTGECDSRVDRDVVNRSYRRMTSLSVTSFQILDSIRLAAAGASPVDDRLLIVVDACMRGWPVHRRSIISVTDRYSCKMMSRMTSLAANTPSTIDDFYSIMSFPRRSFWDFVLQLQIMALTGNVLLGRVIHAMFVAETELQNMLEAF